MANTYANLGNTIGNILSRGAGTRTSGPAGRMAGIDAGSQHMLRSAQTNKSMADTEKILYELSQAQQGDDTSANAIAHGMGVSPGYIDALSEGEMTTPALNPTAPGVPIPQHIQDKYTNATTAKIMQQLTGGVQSGANVDTMMSALLKGQEAGTRSNLQSGAQSPVPVAQAEAALLGKLDEASGVIGAGSGGKPSADVQMFNLLTSARGGRLKPAEAVEKILGPGADMEAVDALLQSLVRSGLYEVDEIQAMVPQLLASRKDPQGAATDPLSLR